MPPRSCTPATTRSSCRRCARWSPGWSATSAAARAAAGPPLRRSRKGWRRGRPSASRSWRWPPTCASPTPSATGRLSGPSSARFRCPAPKAHLTASFPPPSPHATGYGRLPGLFLPLFGLQSSEGAWGGLFRRAKRRFEDEAAAILARLRRARVVCSDETTVRVDGRTCWDWVFRNDEVAIHVIRPSRGRAVVAEVLGGHRPAIWVSDLHGAQRGHADLWQVCLAHQLRDLRHAVEAGDAAFAPRLKALLLRAVVLARRRHALKAGTRREYRLRLERELDRVPALRPSHRHGRRLRRRYLAVRDSLFTFLEHPDAPPDNDGSERDLRPMVVYRKVTGGFRSAWGPDLCAAVASVVGTAARRGMDAYHAIHAVLSGRTVLAPG